MFAIAVRGKARSDVEAGLAGCDDIEDCASDQAADDLGDNVGNYLLGRKAAAGSQSQGNSRVEMAT